MTLPNDATTLSPQGAARRDAMRSQLSGELTRIIHRRRARRRAACTAALLLAIGGSIWLMSPAGQQPQPSQPVAQTPIAPPADHIRVHFFADNPGLTHVARLDVRVPVSTVSISDEELLEALAAIGRPTGLARIGDKAVTTTAVTDDEQTPAEEPSFSL